MQLTGYSKSIDLSLFHLSKLQMVIWGKSSLGTRSTLYELTVLLSTNDLIMSCTRKMLNENVSARTMNHRMRSSAPPSVTFVKPCIVKDCRYRRADSSIFWRNCWNLEICSSLLLVPSQLLFSILLLLSFSFETSIRASARDVNAVILINLLCSWG